MDVVLLSLFPLKWEIAFFLILVFSSALNEWNKFDACICHSSLYSVFKKDYFKFYKTHGDSVFNTHYPKGLTFLYCICVGLSHLKKHKFNPLYNCSFNIETLNHFFLHYPKFTNEKEEFLRFISKKIWLFSLYKGLTRNLSLLSFYLFSWIDLSYFLLFLSYFSF